MSQSGILDAKLRELERQYDRMLDNLRLYRTAGRSEVRQALENVWGEYLKQEQFLQECADGSRSPAVAALSEAQLNYSRRVRQILREDLPRCLHSENSGPDEDRLEAAGLYGEYAIDFAVQSVRYALLAALSAADAQMKYEEESISLKQTE